MKKDRQKDEREGPGVSLICRCIVCSVKREDTLKLSKDDLFPRNTTHEKKTR